MKSGLFESGDHSENFAEGSGDRTEELGESIVSIRANSVVGVAVFVRHVDEVCVDVFGREFESVFFGDPNVKSVTPFVEKGGIVFGVIPEERGVERMYVEESGDGLNVSDVVDDGCTREAPFRVCWSSFEIQAGEVSLSFGVSDGVGFIENNGVERSGEDGRVSVGGVVELALKDVVGGDDEEGVVELAQVICGVSAGTDVKVSGTRGSGEVSVELLKDLRSDRLRSDEDGFLRVSCEVSKNGESFTEPHVSGNDAGMVFVFLHPEKNILLMREKRSRKRDGRVCASHDVNRKGGVEGQFCTVQSQSVQSVFVGFLF